MTKPKNATRRLSRAYGRYRRETTSVWVARIEQSLAVR
jgi:hypothetical protein